MKILVCIKQVPDQESRPTVNQAKTWVGYFENASYWINRYDEHAEEEALRIREMIPGTTIDIVSFGPERVKSAIKRCIEMGADRGFHLYYDRDDYHSPSIKSRLIAEFCKNQEYDLILTGVMSEDMMSGQTGPMIAARLGVPSATSVIKLEINTEKQSIQVERELDSATGVPWSLCCQLWLQSSLGLTDPDTLLFQMLCAPRTPRSGKSGTLTVCLPPNMRLWKEFQR